MLSLEDQAKFAFAHQDWPLAEAYLRRVLQEGPHRWECARLLSQVLRECGRFEAAEETLVLGYRALENSEEADEGQPELLLELADLRLQTKRPGEAARALKRILLSEPKHWEALYLLGHAFAAVGAYQEALNAYRDSLESQPFEREIWWHYALTLEQLGAAEEAAEAYEAYLTQKGDLSEEEDLRIRAHVGWLRMGRTG